jgi:hypothetical protein
MRLTNENKSSLFTRKRNWVYVTYFSSLYLLTQIQDVVQFNALTDNPLEWRYSNP